MNELPEREADRNPGAEDPGRALGAHWGIPGTLVWGVLLIAFFVYLQGVVTIAVAARGRRLVTQEEIQAAMQAAQGDGVAFCLSAVVGACLLVPLVLLVIRLKAGARIGDYLALKAVPWKALLSWCAAMGVFIACSDLLTIGLGRPLVPEVMTTVYRTTQPVWLVWTAFLITAPISEEVLFRGFLFKGFQSLSPWLTTLLVAAAWAGLHMQYDGYGMASVFAMGLLLGAARARTGSLFPSLLMHALANVVATLETVVILGKSGG